MLNETVFDAFPVLETERLILREITPDDAEQILRIFADPRVIRYWGAAPMVSIEEAYGKIAGITAAFREKFGIRWAINAAMQPVSTSPLPPVAMPGLPVSFV